MRPEEFQRIRENENTHWWYHGRARLLSDLSDRLQLSGKVILDAGCGTGFALRCLKSPGFVVEFDLSPDAVALLAQGDGKAGCQGSLTETPFIDSAFDIAISMDVLEHIEDDALAIQELYRVLKPGGHLFLTVPAYGWMRSGHDEALGHRRRYSMSRIRRLVLDAGFDIETCSGFVSTLFPLAVVHRTVRNILKTPVTESDLTPIPAPMNTLFTRVILWEARRLWKRPLAFGLTMVVLAVKPAGD